MVAMVALTPDAERIVDDALFDLYMEGVHDADNNEIDASKTEETKTRILAAITGAELGYTT